jgi:hypothetical protein
MHHVQLDFSVLNGAYDYTPRFGPNLWLIGGEDGWMDEWMNGWPLLLQNKDFIDLEIHDTLVPHPTMHSPSFIEKKSLLFASF